MNILTNFHLKPNTSIKIIWCYFVFFFPVVPEGIITGNDVKSGKDYESTDEDDENDGVVEEEEDREDEELVENDENPAEDSDVLQLYSCSDCGETFRSEISLQKHLEEVHELPHEGTYSVSRDPEMDHEASIVKEVVRCTGCKEEFCSEEEYRAHSQGCTGKKLSAGSHCYCEECGKFYKSPYRLKCHQKRGHRKAAPVLCSVCGKSFSSRSSFQTHMAIHKDLRKFECEQCHRKFRQKCHLQKHMLNHTGERPFLCSMCPKSFKQMIDVQRHMRTHTGEKPYACEICGRSFSVEHCLKAHMRIHSGLKPYTCNQCGASFRVKVTLDRHMITHSELRPYQCSGCQQSFKRKDHLRQHWMGYSGKCPRSQANKHKSSPTKEARAKEEAEPEVMLTTLQNSAGFPLQEEEPPLSQFPMVTSLLQVKPSAPSYEILYHSWVDVHLSILRITSPSSVICDLCFEHVNLLYGWSSLFITFPSPPYGNNWWIHYLVQCS